MSKVPLCVKPVTVKKEDEQNPKFKYFVEFFLKDHINQVKPYRIDFEANLKCFGSCAYCYSSSCPEGGPELSLETIKNIFDQAYELGVRVIQWAGGDPILHPHWYEAMSYAAEKGMNSTCVTSGLISKQVAKQIYSLGEGISMVGVHIDSVDQATYNKIHLDPKTLEMKIRGYHNLLEAGIPADNVVGIIMLTSPILPTIEETIDWYVDEMGTECVLFCTLDNQGYAAKHLKEWEVSLSETKKAIEYRAKKLGQHWLRIGSSDGGYFYCRTTFGIHADGAVSPCLCIKDLAVGNVYKEPLKDIFESHRDELLFNYEIQGPCGNCMHNDVCNGCRANAHHYLGDVRQSDPKCFMNCEAQEYYWAQP